MENKYYTYEMIPKKVRNGINARIKSSIEKYGFEAFRKVSLKYIDNVKTKAKLEDEITRKEEELQALKESK